MSFANLFASEYNSLAMKRTFIFNGYDIDEDSGELTFHYTIKSQDQTTNFTEKLIFPNADFSKVPNELFQALTSSLSLMLGVSYWKLHCPKKIEIKDDFLTKKQAEFWNTVYTKGLGEFFYKNNIDYRGFFNFPYHSNDLPAGKAGTYHHSASTFQPKDRSLLMLGGGKDSIVSAELLKEHKKDYTGFVVNDHPLQKEIINLSGVDSITVQREIDPKLLELNKEKGAYNGHVPVSAIYAFIALFAAAVYDYRYVISSNERSANYGNVEYLGETINHQWSKSLEFEEMFQKYVKKCLTSNIYYFSLLRPLHEIKIAQLFAKYTKYFSTFSSCNRNFTIKKSIDKKWCGQCAKCAFIFATLAAFLSKEEIVKIFGKNLFADKSLVETYQELLGIKNVKPFECVGTSDEVKLALYLAYKKREFNDDVIIQMFEKDVLPNFPNVKQLNEDLLIAHRDNLLPSQFIPIVMPL